MNCIENSKYKSTRFVVQDTLRQMGLKNDFRVKTATAADQGIVRREVTINGLISRDKAEELLRSLRIELADKVTNITVDFQRDL